MLTTDTRAHRGTPRALSLIQQEASEAYRGAYEAARSERSATRRLRGSETLRLAKAALTPMDIAILDMLAGKGVELRDLAQRTGRKPDQLWSLYQTATTNLARHLEAAAAEGG